MPPNETSQLTPSENPAPSEHVPAPENIPEPQPTEPTLVEEIKSESNSAEASLNKPISQITTDPTNPNPPATASPESSRAGITIEKTRPTEQIQSGGRAPDTVTITEVMLARHDGESGGEPKVPVPEVSKGTFDTKTFLASLLPKLKEKLSFRTEKRLSKIMELARKNGEIQNDEVEKLLHVSDASASRYLEKLVKRGSLRVSGPKNHSKYLSN